MALQAQQADTLKPKVDFSEECGFYTIHVTELRPGDTGVFKKPIPDFNQSNNFKKKIYVDSSFTVGEPNRDFNFYLEVDNLKRNASIVFYVSDGGQNIYTGKIEYSPELVVTDPPNIDFLDVQIGDTATKNIEFKTSGKYNAYIKKISLINGKYFELADTVESKTINNNNQIDIDLHYRPKVDIDISGGRDVDTLVVETDCLTLKIPIYGKPVLPKIKVEDVDFGHIFTGEEICKTDAYGEKFSSGLMIINPGSGILEINGYEVKYPNSPLNFSGTVTPKIEGLRIKPKDTAFVELLCFRPQEAGDYYNEIIFSSNASIEDSVAELRGLAFNEGPYVTGYDFGRERVGAEVKGFVEIMNNGGDPVDITEVLLQENTTDFEILYDEIEPSFEGQDFIRLFPEEFNSGSPKSIKVPVVFKPDSEFQKTAKVRIITKNNDPALDYNYIKGYAFLPKIGINSYKFEPSVMVNTFHPDTAKIKIKNVSGSGELFIASIDTVCYNAVPEDFVLIKPLPEDITIAPMDSIIVPVLFRPVKVSERTLGIRVRSDALRADNDEKYTNTTAFLRGYGYDRLKVPLSFEFTNVLKCEFAEKQVPLKNLSEDTLTINSLKLKGDDAEDFVISDIDKKDIKIPPGEIYKLDVKFIPSDEPKYYYNAILTVQNEGDKHTIFLTARTYKINLHFSLDTLENLAPGSLTVYDPNLYFSDDFRINLQSDNWEDSEIDSLSIELKFPKNTLRFRELNQGNIAPNINIFDKEEKIVNDSTYSLELSLSSDGTLDKNGVLAKPVFELLLGANVKYKTIIGDVSFYEREGCFNIYRSNGLITYDGCNLQARRLQVSEYPYSMKISPNPSSGETITVDYSLAFESEVKLELYSSNGKFLMSLFNGIKEAGEYKAFIESASLTSGTYNLRYKTDSFSETKRIIISK